MPGPAVFAVWKRGPVFASVHITTRLSRSVTLTGWFNAGLTEMEGAGTGEAKG
jgi:hypothetical protein